MTLVSGWCGGLRSRRIPCHISGAPRDAHEAPSVGFCATVLQGSALSNRAQPGCTVPV